MNESIHILVKDLPNPVINFVLSVKKCYKHAYSNQTEWDARMSHKDSFQRLREICGNPGTPELVDTYLESVHFFCDTEPVPRTPVLCDPGIIIIGQGQKNRLFKWGKISV